MFLNEKFIEWDEEKKLFLWVVKLKTNPKYLKMRKLMTFDEFFFALSFIDKSSRVQMKNIKESVAIT